MAKETFIEYWDKYKRQYKYGHDYIDIDCGKYVAIVPAKFELISGIQFMSHCYSSRLIPFCTFSNAYYFNPNKQLERGIKVFVFEKKVTIEELSLIDKSITNYANPYIEFTFWISQYKSDHLYGLHNHRNVMISSYQRAVHTGDGDFKCICDCEEEYEYYHGSIGHFVKSIRQEFFKHKKDLLRTIYNSIYEHLDCAEHTFTPKTVEMYRYGFDFYWKNIM